MATQIVELTGDEARLLKALDRVVSAEEKHRKKLEQTAASGRQAGDGIAGSMIGAEEVMKKRMDSIIRELGTLGPAGKKAADQLAANFAKGANSGRASLAQISQEYTKASALLGRHRMRHSKQNEMQQRIAELRRLGPEGKKAADQLSKHLRETGKDGSRSLSQITRELQRIDPAAAKAAMQTNDIFGNSAIGKIAKYAAGFTTLTAAIGTVRQAFAFMAQEKSKALDSLLETTDPEQRLLQVSRDQGDFEAMVGTADNLSSQFGVDRTAARELVFSARSEGFESALPFIGSNAPVIPVGAQATVAGQIPGLFTRETITPEQAINATLAAAEASRLDFSQIARSLPQAAEGGAIAGASFAETAGTLSVLASRFKSGDTAADRIKAFTTKTGIDDQFKGLGIIAAVEKLQAMSDEDRKGFLKDSQELNAAYVILTEELDAIKDRVGVITQAVATTGTDQSPTSIKRAIARDNARLSGRQNLAAAEARQEINRENRFGTAAAERQAAVADVMANLDTNEATGIQKFAAQRAADAAGAIGVGRNLSAAAASSAAETTATGSLLETGVRAGAGGQTVGLLLDIARGIGLVANNTAPGPPNPSAAQRAAIAGDN